MHESLFLILNRIECKKVDASNERKPSDLNVKSTVSMTFRQQAHVRTIMQIFRLGGCAVCTVRSERDIPQSAPVLSIVPAHRPPQVRWIKDSKLPVNMNISVWISVLSLIILCRERLQRAVTMT